MTYQREMLTLPVRRHVGPGNHDPREELREHLRIEAVGFLGGFGDDPELLGIGQHKRDMKNQNIRRTVGQSGSFVQ